MAGAESCVQNIFENRKRHRAIIPMPFSVLNSQLHCTISLLIML